MQWIHLVFTMHGLALALIGSLLIAVLFQQEKRPVHWFFFAMLACGFNWIAMNGLMEWLTLRGIQADWVGSLGGVSIQGMALSAFLLCVSVPGEKLEGNWRWVAIVVALGTLALCPLLFSPDWISNRRNVGGMTTASYGPYFILASSWAAGIVILGIVRLSTRYRAERDSRRRLHMRMFLIGGGLSFAVAVVLSFLLPLFGYDRFFFLGLDSVLLFFALVTHGILFHKLFDLRGALLKLSLRFVLGVFLTVVIYGVFLTLILDRNISEFSYELAAVLSLFFLAAMFFARFVLPSIDNLLFRRPPKAEDAIMDIFANVAIDAPMERAMQEVFESLATVLPFKQGLMIAADYQNRFYLRTRGCDIQFRPVPARLYARLLRLESLPPAFLSAFDRAFLLETSLPFTGSDLPGKRYRRILRVINESLGTLADDDFQLVLPLIYGRTLCGFIILGEKEDDFPYYMRDLKYLNALRLTIGALLQFRRQWNRLRSQREEARDQRDQLTDLISARGAGGVSPAGGRGGKPATGDPVSHQIENRQMLYRSSAMQAVMDQVQKFSRGDQSVLVTGETGTGKELIARLIHKSGPHADSPFVAVNCAAISDQLWEDELFGHVKGAYTDAKDSRTGRIAEAGAGVLFLDEVGEMPLEMQAKLLRLLQERKYSPVGSDQDREARCRFVFATNRDLAAMIADGGFREDLYYRINVFHLDLPPLRNRPEDVPLLLEHFVARGANELGFNLREIEPAALQALARYAWPGNIRELENFVTRASALSDSPVLALADLPQEMRLGRRAPEVVVTRHEISYSEKTLRELVDDYTRGIIEETLKKTEGNRTRAADLLGVKRGSLLYRMKELGVE